MESIPGVAEVDPDVNANTSGTLITLKISANSYDEDELKSVAKEALTNILKDPRIGYASFSMGVFSPNDSINIAPSDVGCIGTGTTDNLRGCFAWRSTAEGPSLSIGGALGCILDQTAIRALSEVR